MFAVLVGLSSVGTWIAEFACSECKGKGFFAPGWRLLQAYGRPDSINDVIGSTECSAKVSERFESSDQFLLLGAVITES